MKVFIHVVNALIHRPHWPVTVRLAALLLLAVGLFNIALGVSYPEFLRLRGVSEWWIESGIMASIVGMLGFMRVRFFVWLSCYFFAFCALEGIRSIPSSWQHLDATGMVVTIIWGPLFLSPAIIAAWHEFRGWRAGRAQKLTPKSVTPPAEA